MSKAVRINVKILTLSDCFFIEIPFVSVANSNFPKSTKSRVGKPLKKIISIIQ